MSTEHIWTIEKWQNILPDDCRTGLYLRFDKGIDSEVHRCCKEFGKWLRTEYFFPMKIPVYIKNKPFIKAMDGELVAGTFFAPYDYNEEPYIRIAAGDYSCLLKERGKDNALAAILYAIAHELTHYYQWINGSHLTERGKERQATNYSRLIVSEYAETREHP